MAAIHVISVPLRPSIRRLTGQEAPGSDGMDLAIRLAGLREPTDGRTRPERTDSGKSKALADLD
jgi:hypothetical protein